jgi:hypothetical protein
MLWQVHLVAYPNSPYPVRILWIPKTIPPHDFHPLSYVHLETAQKPDPHLKKELLNKTCKCKLKHFHRGGICKITHMLQ